MYAGLPTQLAPTPRLIGAVMSVRRDALRQIGYFHSDNHDDMDMCHRLAWRWPEKRILFEPRAVARHYVHPDRLTWGYFWRRCFFVNRGKVEAHRNLPRGRNLDADRQFVTNALSEGLRREGRGVWKGDLAGLARIAVLVAGIILAAAGYSVGSFEYWRGRRERDGGTDDLKRPAREGGPMSDPRLERNHPSPILARPNRSCLWLPTAWALR